MTDRLMKEGGSNKELWPNLTTKLDKLDTKYGFFHADVTAARCSCNSGYLFMYQCIVWRETPNIAAVSVMLSMVTARASANCFVPNPCNGGWVVHDVVGGLRPCMVQDGLKLDLAARAPELCVFRQCKSLGGE
jgi:hypothetical protein